MTSENPLTFYDIRCVTETCFSPNTWKTRLALNYKKIPYQTIWLSFPDIDKTIRPHCQQDAKVITLPVIKHGDTWVNDSWNIIVYLEKTFPDVPSLFTPTIEQNYFFSRYNDDVLIPSAFKTLLPLTATILDKRGQEFFVPTREERLGVSLNELGKGQSIEDMKGPLTPVYLTLKKYGPYIGGKQISYQDILLCALLLWTLSTGKTNLDKALGLFGDGVLKDWYEKVVMFADSNGPAA